MTPQVWQDTLDTNLTGVWNTMVVSVPHLIAAGGGSIICTSSTAGSRDARTWPRTWRPSTAWSASPDLANELARHSIRVNTVHPTGVDTPMGNGLGGLEPLINRDPNLGPIYMNTLPVETVDPRDISNAVLFLASDEARYVTGLEFPVDAGQHDQMTDGPSLAAVYDRVAAHLVGRERELTLVLAAVAAGRDIILEGPPGTSKSTLLRAITAEWGIPLVFVEGNADLTPSKLIGHHNPARVLREDYSPDNFVDGPLLQAMRDGGFLYIEEFNRAPEDTLNTLLTAMAERQVAVPTAGIVTAAPTFRVVASMNPYDNVGTTRLSTSVHDRICRLAIGYQDAAAERGIVALRAPLPSVDPGLYQRLVADAVAVTRATREHPDIRQGSSVRGAIDLTLVAGQLLELRGPGEYPELVYDAMVVALSGRIFLDETVEATPEAVLRQIWEDQFILAPAAAAPG